MRYNTRLIDRERILKGWTRRKLGEVAGVSENMVGQFLNHQVGTPRTAKCIADALGLSMSAILIDSVFDLDVQSSSDSLPRQRRQTQAKA